MAFETHESTDSNPQSQPMGFHSEPHQLPCDNCGMPLYALEMEHEMRCAHCGQHHHFLDPPMPAQVTDFQVGDNVAAEWEGHWWPAHIVEEIEKNTRWRIHLDGWAPAFDAVVDSTRIRIMDYTKNITLIQANQPNDDTLVIAEPKAITLAAAIILILLAFLGLVAILFFSDPLTLPGTFSQMYPPVITAPNMEK
ncbi:MAG: hypothetical protein JXR76_19795 [Deltaproteobacteria bacterium]|nr:hypothetical protein [Deltaproteobacteria bacterium]